jgi:hypothetical protein
MGVPAPVWVKVWDISGLMQTPQKTKKWAQSGRWALLSPHPAQGVGALRKNLNQHRLAQGLRQLQQ